MDGLYTSREGLVGLVLISVEDAVNCETWGLDEYEGVKEFKRRREDGILKDWKEKPLHSKFLRQTSEIANSRLWLI